MKIELLIKFTDMQKNALNDKIFPYGLIEAHK